MTKEEVLQQCTIEGLIVKLPPTQLERKLYTDVAKSLELIGGKWKGGKVAGFVFAVDPTDLLEQITNGEKRNLKKNINFLPHLMILLMNWYNLQILMKTIQSLNQVRDKVQL